MKSRAWVKKHYFPALGTRAWMFAVKTDKQSPDGKPVWLRFVYASETKILGGRLIRMTRSGRTNGRNERSKEVRHHPPTSRD